MKKKYRPASNWYNLYNKIDNIFYHVKKENDYDVRTAKTILLSYPHLLGDSVLLTPFLVELRRICPNTQIDLVGDKACETVLKPLNIITNFYNFGNSSGMHGLKQMLKNHKEISNAIKEIRKYEYDVAIDPFCDWGATYLVRKAKAKHKIGFDFFGTEYSYSYIVKTQDNIEHIVDDMLFLLNDISGGEANIHNIYPQICLSDSQEEFLIKNKEKIISQGKYIVGIHPGASQQSKKWLGYGELIKIIDEQQSDIQFLIFEGPGESETVDELFEEMGGQIKNEVGRIKLPLANYIASLSLCNIVICNDSSCGHLSAALGIPVVVVYGQGCPSFIGVRSNRSPVEIVDVKNIECKPCYQDICPNGSLKCIKPITVEEVLKKVNKIFNEHKR